MSAAFFQPGKPVVLCVEDDVAEQRLLKTILEENGFEVLEASTAATGWQLFRKNSISLVVIDQRLGHKQMTGAQLARKIKRANRNIPVVLRSGYPPESMGSWDVFVNKGESVEAFLAIVQDLIRRYAA